MKNADKRPMSVLEFSCFAAGIIAVVTGIVTPIVSGLEKMLLPAIACLMCASWCLIRGVQIRSDRLEENRKRGDDGHDS